MTSIEETIIHKKLSGPRITPEHINDVVVADMYWQPPGTTLTICVLTLKNGTLVVGESACVSPENFDEALGKRIARDNAKEKIWALEGYLLKETLHQEAE